MKIEQWPLSRIKPYDKNPRVNDDAVDAVAASLRSSASGSQSSWTTNGVIICRAHALEGRSKARHGNRARPCRDRAQRSQIRAYRIADNQTATLAEWDHELLPIELAELREMNYDLALIGFLRGRNRRLAGR